jgi:hypothetical protein
LSGNPYAPPTAKVEDIAAPTDPNAPRRRPVLVWVICVWIWFGLVSTPLGFYWVLTSDAPEFAAARAYYAELSTLTWLLMAVALVLSLVMSIHLFRLKRVAFTLAVAQLALGVFNAIVMPEVPTEQDAPSYWIGAASGIVFYVLVVIYLRHLRRKNVLR